MGINLEDNNLDKEVSGAHPVVTIQYMLDIFIIAAVAVHVSLSSRELLGLGGKQDKNICSIHKSDLAAQRTPQETNGCPKHPKQRWPSVTNTPLRDCDLSGRLPGGSYF